MSKVHPNFIEERSKIKFDLHELSQLYFGSQEDVDKLLKMQEYMDNSPIHKHNPDFCGLSREQRIRSYIKRMQDFHKKFNYNTLEAFLGAFVFFGEPLITSLHQGMFIPCLRSLASPKQSEIWVPLAESYKIVGCYAQTEMGHGSDVQSLETIATFDRSTDSFILDSPTLTATKMWPGDLGVFSTHAMVFAQLIINNISKGVQAFLVPIRDMETHEVLAGVEVGDIGPKYGFGTKDNGYLRLQSVRIPRENMLMKYAKVTKEGEFKLVGDEKALYGVMMSVRLIIAGFSPRYLLVALTIALRYSLLRTQFFDDAKKERKILDYQLQQEKLFPLLSEFMAMAFTSMRLRKLVAENMERIKNSDFSLLNETHIVLAGCKSYFTHCINVGVEKCRLSCGGHGFSHYSGLPELHQEVAANCTLEGENTVMYLQVARYLLKMFNKASKGQKVSGMVDYYKHMQELLGEKSKITSINELLNPEELHKLLIRNALHWIYSAGNLIITEMGSGLSMKQIWDKKAGIVLVEAARSHTQLYAFECFYEGLGKVRDTELKKSLGRLLGLFAVHVILERPMGVIEAEYLNVEQFKLLQKAKEKLLEEIRPDAMGFADASLFSDNSLRSALGRFDGNVYETMFDWAQNKNSLNGKEVADGMEYIFQMKGLIPNARL